MSRLLVDTNVLVYAIDQDSKYHLWPRRVLTDENTEIYTTSKNLSEFLAVVTRKDGPHLSCSDAISVIGDFRTSCNVLYPDALSYV
ncbi:hypothetical protein KOR42_47830 [Thalassoglobus neptunius]|uniref:PIN domain-containing protein n=1 Tax=Thalassoglobus neptunius TaxID=1938619 RepID=A0A5C5VVF0_9PLAN|nr:PIN domain-containing protein [Thalassoglobus neptunius]TWT41512.1 hypothetical protein KOR42_47830 [Thalassoglobus neptunius]